MSTFLLDTSVLIDVLNNQRQRGELLTALVTQGHLLACCSVNITEVFAGMREGEGPRTTQLLESLQFYPATFPVARLAGLLKREWRRQGITLAVGDVTVAAVALQHHLTLMTDNIKHYPMQGLSLYPLPKS